MSNISWALEQLGQGLAMWRDNKAEQHESWLSMLARWHTRLNTEGDRWTWREFEDVSIARAALEARNLSTGALRAEANALLERDKASRTRLIREIEIGAKSGLADRIRALVADGEDPNAASLLKNVPLAFARDRGMPEVFDLLLELGADPAKIGFDALHQAVRFGTLADVMQALPGDDPLLAKPDVDAPLALAITRGDAPILAALLDAVVARGEISARMVETCLGEVIQQGRTDLATLFLDRGADPDAVLEDLTYRYDTELLELCIAHGADVTRIGDLSLYHEDPAQVAVTDGVPAISRFVDVLLAAGWRVDHLDEFENGQIRLVTKAYLIPAQDRTAPEFADPADHSHGTANPQEVTAPYHLEMARTGVSSFFARREWAVPLPCPSWTLERFGQSTTWLPDGRWVQIAGEHEDAYDPDFEIYNDVVIHDGQGGLRVLFYPREVFEPTDFHTATLVDDAIWIIGNTGYMGSRRVGETPVYRLDLKDFSITRVIADGVPPGWISRHEAALVDGEIVLSGGWIFAGQTFEDNARQFRFDPVCRHWIT